MSILHQIIEPTLLLDEAKCKSNILKMVEKAARNGVRLRPHFKTHQSHAVGQWFRAAGVRAITTSSLRMACYFAADGWDDITVAFPVNTLEQERLNRLAKKIKLNVLVEDAGTVARLNDVLQHPVGVFIKVDLGSHRTGVSAADTNTIDGIIAAMEQADKITFKGFLAHAGHSYHARSHAAIQQVHEAGNQMMQTLHDRYIGRYPQLEIATGDTPTASICEGFGPTTEIRPGNYVFYDVTQAVITSCTYDEIAVALACPVVAKHKDRLEIVLYGGGIHFSKDVLEMPDGTRNYGAWVPGQGNHWGAPVPGCYMSKLSQEHGILKVTAEWFDTIHVGDILLILPVHSCMTADLMGSFTTLDGNRLLMMDKHEEYFLD
jgi:D-serine deaminase-like pyridoxal phosphate-dependent protein